MARDPDERGAFVFELVDDDGADAPPVRPGRDKDGAGDGAGPDDEGADGAGADEPATLGVPGARLRGLAPVAAVLAVVLGTGFAVDGLRDAARIERIRAVPGGVVDVSAPLQEVWTWEGQVGSEGSFDGFMMADLRGVLAFRSGEELVGLDPASGVRAWSVPLGENPDCGPVGYPGPGGNLATSVLVCLHGAGAAREVVTVRPGGVASESRGLDPEDDRRYGTARPGPDGTVLRARRIGPESVIDVGDARCAETTGECSGTVEAGRDLLLRAEDAVTGAERWRVTIPFRATGAHECAPWFGTPWNGWDDGPGDEALAPDAFGAEIRAGLVDLWGCGIWSSVTPGGVLLGTDGVPGLTRTTSLGGGRYASQVVASRSLDPDAPVRTMLFGPDGETLGEIPGSAAAPGTIDEPDAMTLLAPDQSGYRMSSYTTDGTGRWVVDTGGAAPGFLAQVAGTVVTTSWTGGVRGYDLGTGAERWRWEPGDAAGTRSFGNEYATQAFTDGRFVLLLLQHEAGGLGVASLDATSGELAWDGTATADDVELPQDASLISVGGHLLAVTPTEVIGLG